MEFWVIKIHQMLTDLCKASMCPFQGISSWLLPQSRIILTVITDMTQSLDSYARVKPITHCEVSPHRNPLRPTQLLVPYRSV